MKMRLFVAAALAACTALAACSSSDNPAQPSASAAPVGASSTASVTAPQAVSPAAGAQIRNSDQPVILVVRNAVITHNTPVTYTFDVAADAAFASKVYTNSGVAEGSGGQTSLTIDRIGAGADYYWHARAEGGGTIGPFSAARKFTIGPVVILNAPVPIAPLAGAKTGPRPALRVTNATRQGPAGAITYRFEIATSAAFSSIVVTGTRPEGVSETGFIPATDVPINTTLYWRATAIDAANGVTSAPSAVQSFTATNPSQAEAIASQQGVTLWPRVQPPGTPGRASMGRGWEIQRLTSFDGVTFNSPTLEALQIFDLLDRGFDPDGAIAWMRSNGYSTVAGYYPDVAAIGFPFQYMAFIDGQWHLVLRVGA